MSFKVKTTRSKNWYKHTGISEARHKELYDIVIAAYLENSNKSLMKACELATEKAQTANANEVCLVGIMMQEVHAAIVLQNQRVMALNAAMKKADTKELVN